MTGPLRLVILVGVAVATTTGLVMGVLRPDIAAGILQSVIVTAREAGVIGWVLLALETFFRTGLDGRTAGLFNALN